MLKFGSAIGFCVKVADLFEFQGGFLRDGKGDPCHRAGSRLETQEVCNLHVEAYSGAEFQHGPIALVSRDYPILIFSPADKSAQSLTALETELCRKGAAVFTTGREPRPGSIRLPVLKRDHPETDAVCLIQSFYRLAIHLATLRGVNADQPRNLQKITRTNDLIGAARPRCRPRIRRILKAGGAAVVLRERESNARCQSELSAKVPTRYLPANSRLTPGFIDLQVNGGGDVLFKNVPTPEAIATIAAAHRRFGTRFPADFIWIPGEYADRDYCRMGAKKNPSVLAFYSWPFLAPDKAGVHDPELIRAPDEARS